MSPTTNPISDYMNPSEPSLHQAVQDIVVHDYFIEGSSLLNRVLSKLSDQLDIAQNTLGALSKINSGLSFDAGEGNVDYEAKVTVNASNFPSGLRSMVLEGKNELNAIISSPLFTSFSEQLQSDLKLVQSKLPANTDNANLETWINSDSIGSTAPVDNITVMNRTMSEIQFLNVTLKSDIQEATMIFEQFTSSTASLLSKLQQLYNKTTQSMGS